MVKMDIASKETKDFGEAIFKYYDNNFDKKVADYNKKLFSNKSGWLELFYWNAFSAIIIINTAEIYIPLMKSNFYSFCFVTHSKTDLTYLPAFSKCYSPFAVIPIRFLSLMIGLFDSLYPQLHFHPSYIITNFCCPTIILSRMSSHPFTLEEATAFPC